jgi:thioredoxin-dependent peroxiredoxin
MPFALLVWRLSVVTVTLVATLNVAGCAVPGPRDSSSVELAAARESTLRGQVAPDFSLPDQNGRVVRLADYRGRWLVVYFYPADGTPGCTCQAREFNETHAEFQRLKTDVLGISPDTVESHAAVAKTYDLRLHLLADPQRAALRAYGAAVTTPEGERIIRSTVIIDPRGRIAYHWPEVIPQGHAERVRRQLAKLQGGRGV